MPFISSNFIEAKLQAIMHHLDSLCLCDQLLLKQHGADPAEGLMIHSLFDRLRQSTLANPLYFSHLIEKYLLIIHTLFGL